VSWLAILLAAVATGAGARHHHVTPHQRLAAHAPVHRGVAVKRPQASPLPVASPVPAPAAVAPPTPTPTATATATPDDPSGAEVILDDDPAFTMSASYRTLKAGHVIFNAANYGMDDHNLTVAGVPGGYVSVPADKATYPLELALAPGTYRLYCSLPGHDAAGMHTTITVR
jgi:plastocyanin